MPCAIPDVTMLLSTTVVATETTVRAEERGGRGIGGAF